jgi:hypothetical protein
MSCSIPPLLPLRDQPLPMTLANMPENGGCVRCGRAFASGDKADPQLLGLVDGKGSGAAGGVMFRVPPDQSNSADTISSRVNYLGCNPEPPRQTRHFPANLMPSDGTIGVLVGKLEGAAV